MLSFDVKHLWIVRRCFTLYWISDNVSITRNVEKIYNTLRPELKS